jgi:hypothetical protein
MSDLLEQIKAKKLAEINSDARVQRKQAMTSEERGRDTINRMTAKMMDFHQRQGTAVSEESVRKQCESAAYRAEKK